MDAELILRRAYRKSSRSGSGGGGCVEAANTDDMVLVRDTTNRFGGTLVLSKRAWRRMLADVKAGQKA